MGRSGTSENNGYEIAQKQIRSDRFSIQACPKRLPERESLKKLLCVARIDCFGDFREGMLPKELSRVAGIILLAPFSQRALAS
jgi:hypothetical protein